MVNFGKVIAAVAAVVSIASAVGAYAIIPYRLTQDELQISAILEQQRQYSRDVSEIKVMLGRLEERTKALQATLDRRIPPPRLATPRDNEP